MSGPGPRFPVSAPIPAPPILSLWSMRERPLPDEEAGERWGNGVTFQSESCGADVDGLATGCVEGAAFSTTSKGTGDLRDAEEFDPFLVVAPETCGPYAGTRTVEADFKARARRLLEACWPAQVEREFWTGDLVPGNRHLTDGAASVLSGSALAVVDAFANLEEGLTDCSCGGPGMIHVTRRVFTLAVAQGLVDVDLAAGTARTMLGTWVVPGAGYTGSSPAGAFTVNTEYAYATGPVKVFRGDTVVYPESLAEALNRATNQVTFRAEAAALVMWDPCCQLAVQVTAPGGGAS